MQLQKKKKKYGTKSKGSKGVQWKVNHKLGRRLITQVLTQISVTQQL